MSTLSVVKKSLSPVLVPDHYTINSGSYRGQEFWLFNADGKGNDYFFSYHGHHSSLKAYLKCPPLTAVINKKAKGLINGKTWILNRSGKAKGKEATGEMATKLRALMMRPNPIQNWKQFEAQNYIYQQVFGFCPVLIIAPVGFPRIEATRMWNIPPFMVDIEETERLFYNDEKNIIKKIVLKYKNEETELSTRDVFIFRDFTPSMQSLVIPESRICSLEMPVNNIIGAYESRNVLINYRGALGILTPEKDQFGVAPIDQDDKEQLQQDFMRYGLTRSQWKFIISSAALRWQSMGVPTRDLMLFEEIDDDMQRICDGYDFPYRLMASEKSNSLGGSDIKQFRKEMYESGVIPDANSIYEQWNELFELDKYNLILDKDFSHISALQEDAKEMATARKTRNEALMIEFYMNMLTLNQWLEKNGEDPLSEEIGNMYYYQLLEKGIKFGKMFSQNNNSNRNQDQDEE